MSTETNDESGRAMEEIPSEIDTLVLRGRIPHIAPDMLFTYWTDPRRICKWWPEEADIEARLGGSYHLSWPNMHWDLRGTFTAFQPGRRLGFTWMWDHNSGVLPSRDVVVSFAPADGNGTEITIVHGPYTGSPRDQEDRQSHLAGWQFFVGRLQTLHAR